MIQDPEKQNQTIYLGRDNPFYVTPKLNGDPVPDFNPTGAEIRYKDVGISSALYPEIFDLTVYATTGKIAVNIHGLALEVGSDPACELILYSDAYPRGVVFEPILELTVSADAVGDAGEIDPLRNIRLEDLRDVDTAGGSTGDVLTQLPDGSFAMAAPTGGSGTGGEIDETLAADLSHSGTVSTITVGEAVSFGDALYRSPADGLYYQARANAVLTVPATRMALASAGIGATCLTLCPGGVVRNDAWNFTDDGSVIEIWLSAAVAGGMTEIVDDSAGCFGQVIGTPLAANILEFRPMLPVARF